VIRDTGRGIDESVADRIFDAFVTTKRSGLGLGLSICKAIIESHEGTIQVDATSRQGTTISFTLPRARQTEQSKTD
jgi:signal transduction histidine kinase